MQEHLQNIQELKEAKEKIKSVLEPSFALHYLTNEIDKKIRIEERQYEAKKSEKLREKAVVTIHGDSIILPKVIHAIKEELEYAKIGDAIYAFDKRGVRDDGSLEVDAYIWIPHDRKYIFIELNLYRKIGKTNRDSLWIDGSFYQSDKTETKIYHLGKPQITEKGKYYPYFYEVIQHIRKTRNIPSFNPIR